MQIELLWIDDCPNHEAAEQLIRDVLHERGEWGVIVRLKVSGDAAAEALRFPGSPTIRVNGRDIEPGWGDTGDYALRCRVYPTREGLRGLPEREWIVEAIDRAADEACAFPPPEREPGRAKGQV